MSLDASYIPQDQKMVLKFHVGNQYCVLTIKIHVLDETIGKLRSFFFKENIPEYLHHSLESAVINTLHQEQLLPIKHSEDSMFLR